jgi:hypothetical protein
LIVWNNNGEAQLIGLHLHIPRMDDALVSYTTVAGRTIRRFDTSAVYASILCHRGEFVWKRGGDTDIKLQYTHILAFGS